MRGVNFAAAARRFIALCLAATLALAAGGAAAHFILNVNIRVIHVEHRGDGLAVYLRLPMALVVAGLVGPEQANGTRLPAPYTINRMEDGQLMHLLDVAALRADPLGLGRLVADGHQIIVDGAALPARVEAVRAYPALNQPLFSDLAQAQAAFTGPAFPEDLDAPYVGDTVLDVKLFYASGRPVYGYALRSTLDPGLPDQDKIANVLLDHRTGGTEIFRAGGLLDEPVEISNSRLAAAWTFVQEGLRHIWEGADHLLFVLCLTIGAVGFGSLAWRVTGFTLGHTATLIAGFLGLAPQGVWFIPAVETAIALSIIYAGAVAVLRKPGAASFVVAAGIGLLHGFGFSFMLREILRADAPDLWVSLLSFNLGVEIGQVAVVAAVWPLLLLVDRYLKRVAQPGRAAVAFACIAVAALWTGERVMALIALGSA